MVNLKPERLTEWNGFSVYDAITGKYLRYHEVAEKSFPEDGRLAQLVDGFCLDWEGTLYLTLANGYTQRIPKEGMYFVQINGNEIMRW